MKIIHLLTAAGIFMASAVAAAPAEAQHYRGYDRDYRGYDRSDYRHRDYRDRRHWDRRHYDRRRHGWNRGRHGWRNQQRCWTEYRWGGPVRVCRR